MKKLTKAIISLSMCSTMLLSSGVIAGAAEVAAENTDTGISTTAIKPADEVQDTIVWKKMVKDGHIYKRRWNVTKGVWVDPEWILVS